VLPVGGAARRAGAPDVRHHGGHRRPRPAPAGAVRGNGLAQALRAGSYTRKGHPPRVPLPSHTTQFCKLEAATEIADVVSLRALTSRVFYKRGAEFCTPEIAGMPVFVVYEDESLASAEDEA
jgi:hypothetical protein